MSYRVIYEGPTGKYISLKYEDLFEASYMLKILTSYTIAKMIDEQDDVEVDEMSIENLVNTWRSVNSIETKKAWNELREKAVKVFGINIDEDIISGSNYSRGIWIDGEYFKR